MKADQLIPGNWYYHNDVLVKFIFNVKTDSRGYRFERAVGRSYSAYSLIADQIENEITHELLFTEGDELGSCGACVLYDSPDECIAIQNCNSSKRTDGKDGYHVKSEIKS